MSEAFNSNALRCRASCVGLDRPSPAAVIASCPCKSSSNSALDSQLYRRETTGQTGS